MKINRRNTSQSYWNALLVQQGLGMSRATRRPPKKRARKSPQACQRALGALDVTINPRPTEQAEGDQ